MSSQGSMASYEEEGVGSCVEGEVCRLACSMNLSSGNGAASSQAPHQPYPNGGLFHSDMLSRDSIDSAGNDLKDLTTTSIASTIGRKERWAEILVESDDDIEASPW